MKTTGIKQTINGIIAFELFFAKRAKRLLEITEKLEYDVKFNRVIYDGYELFENNITVKFTEKTHHEPKSYYQDIKLEELSYTDEEFDSYVKHLMILKEQELEDSKRKKEELKKSKTDKKIENKIKQFEKLKLELGR